MISGLQTGQFNSRTKAHPSRIMWRKYYYFWTSALLTFERGHCLLWGAVPRTVWGYSIPGLHPLDSIAQPQLWQAKMSRVCAHTSKSTPHSHNTLKHLVHVNQAEEIQRSFEIQSISTDYLHKYFHKHLPGFRKLYFLNAHHFSLLWLSAFFSS